MLPFAFAHARRCGKYITQLEKVNAFGSVVIIVALAQGIGSTPSSPRQRRRVSHDGRVIFCNFYYFFIN